MLLLSYWMNCHRNICEEKKKTSYISLRVCLFFEILKNAINKFLMSVSLSQMLSAAEKLNYSFIDFVGSNPELSKKTQNFFNCSATVQQSRAKLSYDYCRNILL